MGLRVPATVVRATQEFLRRQGSRLPEGHEGVVLWVGDPALGQVEYEIVPEQVADLAWFDVPLPERQRIARSLAGTGRAILCQVHSHPEEAWHSRTDDRRALPRNVGALSLVVPDQGRRTAILDGAALYRLDSDGRWVKESLDRLTFDG